MVNKTVITLEKEKITIDTYKEDGMKSTKNTNLENLQQVFLREQALETPLLPSQWGVVKYYKKNNYEGYVMTTPPTIRKVTFDLSLREHYKEELDLLIPPLLWLFEVRTNQDGGKELTHSMLYALKHELLSLKDQVFHAPFSNIGVAHGICWGRVNPSAASSKSLQNIPARFFEQPFNSDLSTDRLKSFEMIPDGTGRSMTSTNTVDFMQLVGQKYEEDKNYTFPYEYLKPVGSCKVEDVIKQYLTFLK